MSAKMRICLYQAESNLVCLELEPFSMIRVCTHQSVRFMSHVLVSLQRVRQYIYRYSGHLDCPSPVPLVIGRIRCVSSVTNAATVPLCDAWGAQYMSFGLKTDRLSLGNAHCLSSALAPTNWSFHPRPRASDPQRPSCISSPAGAIEPHTHCVSSAIPSTEIGCMSLDRTTPHQPSNMGQLPSRTCRCNIVHQAVCEDSKYPFKRIHFPHSFPC